MGMFEKLHQPLSCFMAIYFLEEFLWGLMGMPLIFLRTSCGDATHFLKDFPMGMPLMSSRSFNGDGIHFLQGNPMGIPRISSRNSYGSQQEYYPVPKRSQQ